MANWFAIPKISTVSEMFVIESESPGSHEHSNQILESKKKKNLVMDNNNKYYGERDKIIPEICVSFKRYLLKCLLMAVVGYLN